MKDEIINIFIRFLKENNAYSEYRRAARHAIRRGLNAYKPYEYIIGTFMWGSKPDTDWPSIYEKWNSLLSRIKCG